MTDAKKGVLSWLAVIVPVWLVMILCTHWEPVAHDGWGHWSWHRNVGMSIDHLLDFAWGSYTHNNPRLGQVLTLLLYTPGPYHAIITPLVELALFYLLTLLVLGRAPSLRRADDALLFAMILALAVVTVPSIGLMLFYRPFTGNYLYGLVINLALVVPYRLHFETPRQIRIWWAPALLVLGFAAGLCNEHTGPAFAVLLAVAVYWFWRRDGRISPWAVAGLVGLVAGGIALFLAPGQAVRYNGLANQASTLGRIIDRGLVANGRILAIQVLFLLPAVVPIALGVVARVRDRQPQEPPGRRAILLVIAAMALAITLTLLLSPKQGMRLYLASTVLACAAIAGWVTAQLASRWSRSVAAALCVIALVYGGYRMTSAYHRLGIEFRERVATLEATPDNYVAEIPVYSVNRTRWSLGDDLLIENIRNHVSYGFGLALIKLKTDQRLPTTPPPDEP